MNEELWMKMVFVGNNDQLAEHQLALKIFLLLQQFDEQMLVEVIKQVSSLVSFSRL